MATKLYLTNAPASYNPALVRGAWDANGGIVFGKRLGTLKQGAQVSNGANEASATNNWDVSLFQFVSDPIAENTTLSGTMDYVLGLLGATSLNARTHIHVWVTQGPTTALRGTLVANNIDTTNWPTSPTSFAKTGIALTTVNAIRGDRIVVEVGYRAVNTSGANLGPGVMYAGGTAGDLAASDNPVSTAKSSWVEFSFDIPTISQPVTYQVSAAADDARNIFPGSTFSNSVVTQHLGKFNATTSYDNGWRWLGIPINQGATIISAKLVLFSAAVFAGVTAKARFYGVLENSCTPFANNAANIPGGKTKTTATVDKDFAVSDWQTVGFNETDYIDVTSLIQEIVNQAGWVSGGNIGIVARDNGSSNTNYIGHSTYNSAPARGAKLVLEFLTGDEPDAPSGFTAVENAGNVDLDWTDNSSDELNFEIQRKRGGSSNWYEVATPAADSESTVDDDVYPGYTYTYRIRAVNAAGGSVWVESSPVAMSGTKTWTAKNMAWIYPGSPAENADEEYSDGRYLHFLKPEYYTVNGAGALVQLVDPADGENAYNSTNAADVKDFSEKQFFTISSNAANMKILCEDHVRRTNAINTIISFLDTTGFTGVELDWEQYSSWDASMYTNYKTFVQELGDALHAEGYELMLDGPPITNTAEQTFYLFKYEDFNSLPVDYIVMLLYDYQYDFGAGQSVQPLAWAKNGCKWMRDHVDTLDKIVIGMPSYGYHGTTGGFSITIDTKTQSSAFTGYGGATRNSDGEMTWVNAGTSYVYQDSESMNIKREVIEDEGIRNVSVWHLGGNDWFDAYSEIQPEITGVLIYEDSFNRADADDIGETDGAGLADPFNYEDGGDESGFEIASNQLLSHNGDGGVFMPMIANGSIEMEVTPPTGGVNGIIIRLNFDTGDGYALLAIEDAGEMALSLFYITGYAPDTSIWDSSETYDLGANVKIKAIGTTLNVYVDDVDVSGDIVDTHSGSGNVGFFADSGGIFDNLKVYGVNSVPEADDQSINVFQNTPTEITLTGSDDDSDPLVFKIDSLPAHGTLISPERVLSSDSFNRSDGALGDTDGSGELDPITYVFSPGTTYAISGNRAVITNDGGGGGAGVLQDVTSQDIQVKVKIWPNAIGGVAIHGINGGGAEGYSCYIDVGESKVKLLSGFGPGSTLIDDSDVLTWNDGDELKLIYQGGDLSVYQNDSLIIGPVTDTTYIDAGDFTSLTGDTGTEFDDLEIRALELEYGDGETLPADKVTYVPDTDYIGPDSFDFTVQDDLDESEPATVSITVIQTDYDLADVVNVSDNFSYALSFPLFVGDSVNVFDQIVNTVEKILEDEVTVSDEIDAGSVATYQREFDEDITVSDEITGFVVEKHLAETVTVSETFETEVLFQLSDSVTVSDEISNTVEKNLSESVTVADDTAEVVEKGLAETVTVSEARSMSVQKALSDTVTVSDAPSNITTRPLSDSVTVSDASHRTVTKVIAETVTVSDNFNKVSFFPFLADDSVTVSDEISNTVEKNIADTVSVSEEFFAENEARLTENVDVDDEISIAVEKALADTVTVSDNFGTVSFFPFEASDTVNVNDQISKQLDKYLEDTVNVNDATTRETSKGLADTVTVSDEQLMEFVKTIADTVTVSDQFSTGKNIQLADNVNTADEISKAIEKVLAETVTVNDNFSRTTETERLIEDEVTVSDARFSEVIKNLVETVTVSDELEEETALQRTLQETVTVSESRTMTVTKNLSETVTVSDNIDTQEEQTISDTVSVSDQIVKAVSKNIADTVNVSDSPSTAQTLTLDRSETVTVSDSRTLTVTKVLSESVSVSDSSSATTPKNLSEVVSVSDVISKAVTKVVSDTVTVSDVMDTDVNSFLVPLNDVIIVNDEKSIRVIRTKMYDGNGKRELFINDFQSISELKILNSEGDVVETIPASDFIAYPLNSLPKSSIYLRTRAFPRGRANVLIVGEFTSGAVPDGVVAVATWLVANYLKQVGNMDTGEFESESIEGYTYRLADSGADSNDKRVKSQLSILDSYRKIRI